MSKPLLVIDDDPGICRFLTRALQLRGYRAESCANADEGVDRLLRGDYQLTLIDIQMPGWSGVAACRSLRAHAATRSLPVILMTAFYQDDQDLRRALEQAGASAVLLKPFTLEDLLSRIEALIGPPLDPPASAATAIDGDLAETSLPQLLHNLYSLKATGLLYLENREVHKVVYCRNGYPIFARSNLVRECLGKMLIREKLLTEEECRQSLAGMKESGRLQGTVLMEMGLLSPYLLHEALQRQVTEKLLEVFSWPDGTYRFLPARRFKQGITAIELSPAALILQGVQRHWSTLKASEFLSAYLENYPVVTANPHYRFQSLDLSDAEARLLAQCRGDLSVAALLDQHPLVRSDLEKLLAALILARVIEPLEQPRQAVKAEEPARAAPRPSGTGTRSEILRDCRRMLAQDYFSLLGVTAETDSEGLRRAYFALAKRYHPDRFRHEHLTPDLQARVDEVFQRLRLAYETLSDPSRRRAYLDRPQGEAPSEGVETRESQNLMQAEVAFRKGQALLREGHTARALKLLQSAVAIRPDDPEYLSACAWALHRLRPEDRVQATAARDMLLRAAELNPAADVTQLRLGYLLRLEGRESEAERRFEIAVMCNPDCVPALRELRLIEMRRANERPNRGLLRRLWRRKKD